MSSLPERGYLYISSETRTTPNASDFHVNISNNLYIDSDGINAYRTFHIWNIIFWKF